MLECVRCVCVFMQHDAVSNLRKATSLYVSRQQELDKLKEQAAKAEADSLSLAVAGSTAVVKTDAKTEKKKKQEDDALQKVVATTRTHARTHARTHTHNRLTAFGPGQPG